MSQQIFIDSTKRFVTMFFVICEEKIPTQLLLEVVAGPSVESPDLLPKSKLDEETRRMLAAEKQREYRRTHQVRIREIEKKSKLLHKEKRLAKQKTDEFRARMAAHVRAYRQRHKERLRKSIRERYHSDTPHNLRMKIRSRIYMALKNFRSGVSKSQGTDKLLGCTFQDCLEYLSSILPRGMDRSDLFTNRVHLDHHVPCVLFNLADPEEQRACFNYRNLRPLWAKDNLTKHATIPSPIPEWLPEHIAARVEARRK